MNPKVHFRLGAFSQKNRPPAVSQFGSPVPNFLIRRLLPMGSEPPRRYNEEEIKGFALYYRERNRN